MANIEDMTPLDCLASKMWVGTRWAYLHLERLVREMRALRAECEAWRKAAATMPKQRSAANHDHECEGKWDGTGETCDECALWIAADEARKVTDAAKKGTVTT